MAANYLFKNISIYHSIQKALLCNLRRQYVDVLMRQYSKILSSTELGPRCSYCMTQHQRPFHVSAVLCTKKHRMLKMAKQKKKPDFQVVLRPHMTPLKLAKACRTTVDEIYECLLVSVGSAMYNEPDIVINNMKILKDVVKQLGLKFTTAEDHIQHGKHEQFIIEKKKGHGSADVVRQPPPDPAVLVKRSPVVTIMGHVDHGKTTLLDALRESHIIDQEFGGITQHIGAFSVRLPSGDLITFLDTPGHAAFTAMRARGASITDIVILVIAAEDGVMETTVEAIEHAKEAKVPLIVAINKIDKPGADIEECKKMLLTYDVVVEDFGGDVQVIPISALKRTNLDLLQESVITQAEMMDLKADPVGLVEGHVIESRTDPRRGKLATALIQRGTLKKGDYLVAGTTWTKVRAMYNDQGKSIEEAPPSTPVEIMGWKDVPAAGDEILQVDSQKTVQSAIEWRKSKLLEKKMEEDMKIIQQKRLEHQKIYEEKRSSTFYYSSIKWDDINTVPSDLEEKPTLSIVLKGDVNGSVDAIVTVLGTYKSDLCKLDILSHGVGDITEHDIQMAETFNGVIYAFNVSEGAHIAKLNHEVPIKHFNIIYSLFDDLVNTLSSLLPPLEVEEKTGEADVLQIFQVRENREKLTIGGCRCTKGRLLKKNIFKVFRDEEVIYTGPLRSLKHHKNEVDAIGQGTECGVCLDPELGITLEVGDHIECFEILEEDQEIDWKPGF